MFASRRLAVLPAIALLAATAAPAQAQLWNPKKKNGDDSSTSRKAGKATLDAQALMQAVERAQLEAVFTVTPR